MVAVPLPGSIGAARVRVAKAVRPAMREEMVVECIFGTFYGVRRLCGFVGCLGKYNYWMRT